MSIKSLLASVAFGVALLASPFAASAAPVMGQPMFAPQPSAAVQPAACATPETVRVLQQRFESAKAAKSEEQLTNLAAQLETFQSNEAKCPANPAVTASLTSLSSAVIAMLEEGVAPAAGDEQCPSIEDLQALSDRIEEAKADGDAEELQQIAALLQSYRAAQQSCGLGDAELTALDRLLSTVLAALETIVPAAGPQAGLGLPDLAAAPTENPAQVSPN